MNVLISGASGLIGRALTDHLAGEGHRAVRLVRPATPGATEGAVAWDPPAQSIDTGALETLGPYDAVVNLAGAGVADHRWTDQWRREIMASRVNATRLLATTLPRLDPMPGVLVNASATGFYGDRGPEVLTEESAPGRGYLAQVCQNWEAATAAASESGVRVVRLRTGIVLAKNGGALARQLPLFRLGLGGRLGDGRQYFSWVSLVDLVGIIVGVITLDALEGPVNATAPTPVTNAEMTRALGRALHRPAVLPVPRRALRLALGRDMAGELLGSQRVLPARLQGVGHRFAHPEIATALAAVVA
jgi:uncharacterized protein (TIGR01777 family)